MMGTATPTDVGSFLDAGDIRTFFMERGDGDAVVLQSFDRHQYRYPDPVR